MTSAALHEDVRRIGSRPATIHDDQPPDYHAVMRVALVDGAFSHMLIESEDGSELALGPWRMTGAGDYVSSARVTMADGTDWQVDPIFGDLVEARFERNAEVAVGHPFSIVLFFPAENRPFRINLGKVA